MAFSSFIRNFAAKYRNIMRTNKLKALLLGGFMVCSSLTATGQEEVQIVEHEGNKYTIHVDRLNPDPEMTLLDVLHLCPEFISDDGHGITGDYLLSVDDIMLSGDYRPLLENIKASDLSDIIVCNYGAVNNAMDGITGSIDLQFKEGSKGLDGKVALQGSTYGSGRLFTNISSTAEKVTVRGFVHTSLDYANYDGLVDRSLTTRATTEDALVFVNWRLSDDDELRFKFMQGFRGRKSKTISLPEANKILWPDYERRGELSAVYERNLNDKGAALYLESDLGYFNNFDNVYKTRLAAATWITEFTIPLCQDLSMTAGWEADYQNNWFVNIRREQYLNNDLYVQLDYTHGPWILSLGDRFRINNFWNRKSDTEDKSLWSYHRNEHAFHASIGYKHQRHFIQGTFSRTYLNPSIIDFYNYGDDYEKDYQTDFTTNLAWRAEARYNYQTTNLVLTSSLQHTRMTDMLTPNEYLTGLRTSITWNNGNFRLTAGANFYHKHISGFEDSLEPVYNNFYQLKLAPTWLLGKGFRLSSVLLYNSRRYDYLEIHPHLFASVKVNKDIGRHCNLFADFHDIAGRQTAYTINMMDTYQDRALTIGLTYYPFRK